MAATIVAVVPPEALRGVAATAASALVEAVPLLLASAAIARVTRARGEVAAFLGCGCGTGPAARSLPGAAMAWIVFGPAVACVRFLAATLVSRVRRTRVKCGAAHREPQLLAELCALVPSAILAGAAEQLAAPLDLGGLAPCVQFAAGVLFAFASAPCGLGAIAVAASLHARAPLTAAGFLCVAGIADARAFSRTHERDCGHDGGAYLLLAVGLTIVAVRHGATLVHPAMTPALAASAIALAVLGIVRRSARCGRALAVPALVVAGTFAAAPPPVYRSTETTLTDIFPGERLTFTGALARVPEGDAIVRYAITCCRADAAPVSVRLARRLGYANGTWLRVEGTVRSAGDALRLDPARVTALTPPADPFVYR